MKYSRWAVMAAAALLFPVTTWAAVPTLAEKADKIETTIYGETHDGALLDRMAQAERTVYGGMLRDRGLSEQVDDLYDDVVKSDGTEPSLATRVSTLEWQLNNRITDAALTERVGELETTVYGEEKSGTLRSRVLNLESAVYQNKHYELQEVEIPANTVFKISLSEEVGTKTSHEGDEVNFTVAQDVFVDDVLVLPQGSMGKGVITKIKAPRSFGRKGEVKIAFNQVFGIDDEPIATVLGPESEEKLKREAAAIGASAAGALVLGPIGLVGGYFVKGSDVSMPAGTELYIQVQEPTRTHGVVAVDGEPLSTEKDIVVDSSEPEAKTHSEAKDRKIAAKAAEEKPSLSDNVSSEDADSQEVSDQAGEVADKAEQVAEKAKDLKEKVSDKAEEKADKASSKAEELKKNSEVKIQEIKDKAKKTKEKAEKKVHEDKDEDLPVVIIREE